MSISPKKDDFDDLLDCVHPQKREAPKALFHRVQRYVRQIDDVIDSINQSSRERDPLLKKNMIEKHTDKEKVEMLERIFVVKNDSIEYDNENKLNRKVRQKVANFIREKTKYCDEELTFSQLASFIRGLDEKILPIELRRENDPKSNWKPYQKELSIFLLTPVNKSRKRKIRDDDSGYKPAKKRAKLDKPTFDKEKTCRNSFDCHYYINTGKCDFKHKERDESVKKKTF